MTAGSERVCLITGGSRGIGRAVTEKFLEEGAAVVIAARSPGEVRAAAAEMSGAGRVRGIAGDVARPADVRRMIRAAERLGGTVDVLVNAAGVQAPLGPFAGTDLRRWAKNIEINLVGTARCCRAVLPGMIERGRGTIINFSGGGANFSRPNFSAYAAAKAAVVRFTETLADEVRSQGVRVYAVSPGAVRTRMIEEILSAPKERVGRESRIMRERERSGFDSARAAAELVAFLASPAADRLSGKNISAVWDPWRTWIDEEFEPERDLYVLRRIDGRNFFKAKPE